MKALTGTSRLAFLGFFASHVVFTVIVDSQAILPPNLVPTLLRNFVDWYATTMKDPLMSNPREHLWFQSLVACEVAFQLPFFVVACYFLMSTNGGDSSSLSCCCYYPDWFRCACIAYGAHTATTMAPILATLATADTGATATERAALLAVYLPYLIFPLWILFLAVTTASGTGTTTAKAKST